MVNFRTFLGLLLHFNRFKNLCQLLLFGSTNLTIVENCIVLEAAMAYTKAARVALVSALMGRGDSYPLKGLIILGFLGVVLGGHDLVVDGFACFGWL